MKSNTRLIDSLIGKYNKFTKHFVNIQQIKRKGID